MAALLTHASAIEVLAEMDYAAVAIQSLARGSQARTRTEALFRKEAKNQVRQLRAVDIKEEAVETATVAKQTQDIAASAQRTEASSGGLNSPMVQDADEEASLSRQALVIAEQRLKAALAIQKTVRGWNGMRRHAELRRILRQNESQYKRPEDVERSTDELKLHYDVRQVATRWDEAAEIVSKAQKVWREECAEIYRCSTVPAEETILSKLESLTKRLKPFEHAHFRDLKSKRGMEQTEADRWRHEANHRLALRIERSKLMVRSAWGYLPRSDASSDTPTLGMPDGLPDLDIELPDMSLPNVQMSAFGFGGDDDAAAEGTHEGDKTNIVDNEGLPGLHMPKVEMPEIKMPKLWGDD